MRNGMCCNFVGGVATAELASAVVLAERARHDRRRAPGGQGARRRARFSGSVATLQE
jgi:hypothetical protein